LTTTARRRAIDRIRRDRSREARHAAAAHLTELEELEDDDMGTTSVDDDRLRLIFTCCHPALAMEARIALTLKTVCGLEIDQVARAFLTSEATMYQRLARAKRKITAAGIPYRVPDAADLPERVAGVARVVLLIFNEGHTTTADARTVRADLCDESIRLARMLESLLPDDAEVRGLLALLLLTDARRDARLDEAGELVLLADQRRDRWDHDAIDEGLALLDQALRLDRPGPFQVQASIAAAHAQAPSIDDTDWVRIAGLYAVLEHLDPSPVVRINRAVAVAEADGPLAGLRLLEPVTTDRRVAGYAPLHAAHADLLGRSGDAIGAQAAWRRAIECTDNPAERGALERRLAESVAPGST
jgi:RNA polymerase sigma-70 factor (ECF subfamily)